jgi:hypothetical protein
MRARLVVAAVREPLLVVAARHSKHEAQGGRRAAAARVPPRHHVLRQHKAARVRGEAERRHNGGGLQSAHRVCRADGLSATVKHPLAPPVMGCVSSQPADEPPGPRPPRHAGDVSPRKAAHAQAAPQHPPPIRARGSAVFTRVRSLGRPQLSLVVPPPPPPPPPPDDERGEKVSAVTLERLRSTFLTTASRGSVYDTYTLGDTLGARWRGRGTKQRPALAPLQRARSLSALRRNPPRARRAQARAATRSSSWACTSPPAAKWPSRSCACLRVAHCAAHTRCTRPRRAPPLLSPALPAPAAAPAAALREMR